MISEEIRKIDEKIQQMDPVDAAAISAIDWIGTILEICKKHGFNEEDTLEITREVGYLLLEVAPPGNLVEEIKHRTNLASASITILAEEISREIFGRLADEYRLFEEMSATELKKIREEEREEERLAETNHILVVPIKQKDDTGHVSMAVPIAPPKTVVDPYREAISD